MNVNEKKHTIEIDLQITIFLTALYKREADQEVIRLIHIKTTFNCVGYRLRKVLVLCLSLKAHYGMKRREKS